MKHLLHPSFIFLHRNDVLAQPPQLATVVIYQINLSPLLCLRLSHLFISNIFRNSLLSFLFCLIYLQRGNQQYESGHRSLIEFYPLNDLSKNALLLSRRCYSSDAASVSPVSGLQFSIWQPFLSLFETSQRCLLQFLVITNITARMLINT